MANDQRSKALKELSDTFDIHFQKDTDIGKSTDFLHIIF